jgi:uncharacterized membrane protein
MKKVKEVYMYALGALIALGLFVIIYFLIKIAAPIENKDALLILLGVIAASFNNVVGYFFGSSKGSADKTEMLGKSKETNNEQA